MAGEAAGGVAGGCATARRGISLLGEDRSLEKSPARCRPRGSRDGCLVGG
jgi:hypothetical protein